jgi:hypothetical protein
MTHITTAVHAALRPSQGGKGNAIHRTWVKQTYVLAPPKTGHTALNAATPTPESACETLSIEEDFLRHFFEHKKSLLFAWWLQATLHVLRKRRATSSAETGKAPCKT